jgi:transcriptional regulator with XRE-family HTH domain
VAKKTFELLRSELATQIKLARAEAGLSQEELALEAGVDRTYVSQLERGIANPSLLVLSRLADTLDVEIKVSLVRPRSD